MTKPHSRRLGWSFDGVTTAEAALVLGVTERSVRNWCRSGRLQSRIVEGSRQRAGRIYVTEPDIVRQVVNS